MGISVIRAMTMMNVTIERIQLIRRKCANERIAYRWSVETKDFQRTFKWLSKFWTLYEARQEISRSNRVWKINSQKVKCFQNVRFHSKKGFFSKKIRVHGKLHRFGKIGCYTRRWVASRGEIQKKDGLRRWKMTVECPSKWVHTRKWFNKWWGNVERRHFKALESQ